jgi:selenocysteine lyase/cysteine desulfurase
MGFVLNQAQRAGFQLRCIPTDSDPLDLQVWDDRLDSSCACVLVTHVQSNTSVKVDVAGICALARKSGVMPIVDIAQSVGVTEIDLSQWDADFVLGSCVKWLCGGPGAGFLWANPEIIDRCQPTDVGWFSHADPFEFDIHDFRYAKGVLRFWGGTPSVIPYVVAANSIKLIAQIGVDQVRRHNLALNQRLLDSLPEKVAICPVLPELRGGTAVLNFGQQQSTV